MSNLQHAFPETEYAFAETGTVEAGRHYARLRHVLGVVGQMAGRADSSEAPAALDENARVTSAYEAATPVAQRRFDTLMAEIFGWAATGMDALALADAANPPRAAAACLADELERSLGEVKKLLRL